MIIILEHGERLPKGSRTFLQLANIILRETKDPQEFAVEKDRSGSIDTILELPDVEDLISSVRSYTAELEDALEDYDELLDEKENLSSIIASHHRIVRETGHYYITLKGEASTRIVHWQSSLQIWRTCHTNGEFTERDIKEVLGKVPPFVESTTVKSPEIAKDADEVLVEKTVRAIDEVNDAIQRITHVGLSCDLQIGNLLISEFEQALPETPQLSAHIYRTMVYVDVK